MPRTTVDVDSRALAAARAELGTQGVSATVNAALREIGRRRALAGFDVRRDIDGSPVEVEVNRWGQGPWARELRSSSSQ